jgi:fatty-acyl-CoA synthase
MPMFIRVATALPLTHTSKVIKRVLQQEKWNCADAVWWRPTRLADWREMTSEDVVGWEHRFAEQGRQQVLGLS